MSQQWTDDVFDPNHVAATDLQNMENDFACLKSSFSGTGYPSNVVGGQVCHRPNGRRARNYANNAWLGVLLGDANQKMWVYRNDTCEGWVIDPSVADVVLGIKGGAAAYNVDGGNLAGSWTLSGLTHAHTHTNGAHVHQWYDRASGADRTFNSAGSATAIVGGGKQDIEISVNTGDVSSGIDMDCFTSSVGGQTTSAASTSAISSNGAWRPRAAVGTLQYPDLT
ncbi:hypothetical protein [Desulfatitalea tepidiphila]|uniref:hypothetical protein n=1 Tax=Desulfatitalea tepidiphila TaxID=1185843 RepID=UPI0006B5C66A|nr:hypothetical protein [Desulfatitalea tepidiphila]